MVNEDDPAPLTADAPRDSSARPDATSSEHRNRVTNATSSPLVGLSPGKSLDVRELHKLDHSILVPISTPHLTTTVRMNAGSVG